MIKTPSKKTPKSPKTFAIFLGIMTISVLLLYFIVFSRISNYSFKLSVSISFFLSMLFCLMAWKINPGYLSKDPDLKFMDLLEEFEANCLCPECEVIRTPRSRHCNIC